MKFIVITLVLWVGASSAQRKVAFANLNSGGNGVWGGITFVVNDSRLYLEGTVTNLTAKLYYLEVHESGDVSGNCENIGGIYNPYNETESSPFGNIGMVMARDGTINISNMVNGMTLDTSNGQTDNQNPGVYGLSIALTEYKVGSQDAREPPEACGRIERMAIVRIYHYHRRHGIFG